jgi:hypothetical protein
MNVIKQELFNDELRKCGIFPQQMESVTPVLSSSIIFSLAVSLYSNLSGAYYLFMPKYSNVSFLGLKLFNKWKSIQLKQEELVE